MGEVAGLYWEETGRPDGPPVILSPGLGGSAAYWAPNVAALAAGHRVILYDHRGTGRSDRALPRALGVTDMAIDLHRLMTGIGLASATIVGHAAGAAIGLELALQRPEAVDRLVLVNGWARPDPHFARCMEARLALLHGSGVEAFVRAQPLFLYPPRWISANHARLEAEEAGHIAGFQGAANVAARIAALRAFDIAGSLARIRAPALVLAAEDDMLVPPSCSEALAAGLPDSTPVSMTGGHACNVTEADRFNRIIGDWLDRSHFKGAA